jgi:hypothetical protein
MITKIANTFSEDESVTKSDEKEMGRVIGDIHQVLDDEIFYTENLVEILEKEEDQTVGEFIESVEEDIGEMKETLDDTSEIASDIDSEFGDEKLSALLPGSESLADSEDEDEDEVEDTDYANDGDLSKFMQYISESYPSKIPQHDGKSMLGCERATTFLERINSEISRAIRDDVDGKLSDDIGTLEDTRINIMKDILVLKNHLSGLKKKFKDKHEKKAAPLWINGAGENETIDGEISKNASTPSNIVIAISAFERAVSGMLINSTVSAGYDMEEVYEFLKDKYKLTDREELAIMQIVADSGYHIFKDRGAFSGGKEDKDSNRGVDFMKNYFA